MFNKFLVPLDGSELAERALEPALELARQAGGTVIALRVPFMDTMLIPEPGGYGYAVIWPD